MKRLPVDKLLFSLKWKCIVPLPYFFGAFLPNQTLWANEECFPCQRTGEALGSSPFSLQWQRAISKDQSTLKPESSKEVRSTRSKS